MEHIYGRIPVLECLRARRRHARRLFALEGARDIEPLMALARGVTIQWCDRRELDRIAAGGNHQGIILEVAPLPLPELGDWLEAAPRDAILVVLDGVEDPQNFGAIVRSAAACGAHGVLFGKDRSAPMSPAMVKASAGAAEYIPLLRVTNLVRAIGQCQEKGFWFAAFEADGDRTLWEADLTGRIGLVIGSEGSGVRRLVRERCDLHLRIPIGGPITSLNASVSAGIALAECLRQRFRAEAGRA